MAVADESNECAMNTERIEVESVPQNQSNGHAPPETNNTRLLLLPSLPSTTRSSSSSSSSPTSPHHSRHKRRHHQSPQNPLSCKSLRYSRVEKDDSLSYSRFRNEISEASHSSTLPLCPVSDDGSQSMLRELQAPPQIQFQSLPNLLSISQNDPSYAVSLSKKPLVTSSKVVRKYRSARMRRVKRQEYKKLRDMVPALQEKPKVSKVVVIEEAIKYIDELHEALMQRFKSREIPTTFNGVRLDPREVHGGNIRDLIRRLLANANPTSLPPARIENVRMLPSFLQKLGKLKKS